MQARCTVPASPFTALVRAFHVTALTLNGTPVNIDADPSTPLLWVLRDQLDMTGTKFGCGIASCGACTVHLDGQAIRSCVVPLAAAERRAVLTIEGVGDDAVGRAVQEAWIKHDVPQCGYCQSGQISWALERPACRHR